ncbi:MAG: IclR family transcriptional regulator [Catenulispora sp.]|nr:IclR family transcriptional regulator [Catenulispora sp.]
MTRAVPAVARALDILELFLGCPMLTAAEIAAGTGLPRSTVHELVGTLLERGYLTADTGSPTRFRLGPQVVLLGSRFADRLDLAREAQIVAESVAAECDETVQVAVLDGEFAVCVAKADSTHAVRVVAAVGSRLPVRASALGQALLAGLGTDQAAPDEVVFEHDEAGNDVRSVAAPVRDHSGRVVAALGITVPATRPVELWAPQVRKGAAELSERLGHRRS